jgi:ketosteroid isomerase-like protein
MSQQNVEIVRAGFAAFARGDLDAVLDRCDPDVEWAPAIAPILGVVAVRGRDALRRFFTQDIAEGLDEFRAEPVSFEDLGDSVLVLSRYSGRGGSSGMEIEQTFWTVYMLRNGKIASMRDFGSREEALEAAGVSE